MCGVIARSGEEWRATEQGRALLPLPPVEVVKIADSDPVPFQPGPRPLSGIKALDLTRILAGPVSGRTLAEQGAEVLHVTAEKLPTTLLNILTTNPGKLSTYLDLDRREDADRLLGLLAEADIFTQGFRAGSLERRGFGVAFGDPQHQLDVVFGALVFGHGEGSRRQQAVGDRSRVRRKLFGRRGCARLLFAAERHIDQNVQPACGCP